MPVPSSGANNNISTKKYTPFKASKKEKSYTPKYGEPASKQHLSVIKRGLGSKGDK